LFSNNFSVMHQSTAKLPLYCRALAGQTGAFLQPAVPFVIHALASGGAFTLGLAGAQVTLVQLLLSHLFTSQLLLQKHEACCSLLALHVECPVQTLSWVLAWAWLASELLLQWQVRQLCTAATTSRLVSIPSVYHLQHRSKVETSYWMLPWVSSYTRSICIFCLLCCQANTFQL
jgi:hypothetical protein